MTGHPVRPALLPILRRLRLALPLGALALGLPVGTARAEPPPSPAPAAPAAATPCEPPDLEATIGRAVGYLLRAQNRDGSWGSPASNLFDIYAPIPGSPIAFQVAASSLALSGLLECGVDTPEARTAVETATAWLLGNHGKARRVSADVLYNVWAQAYALSAFARLLARTTDPERRALLVKAAEEQVELLRRFEFVDGGWGYYNFDVVARRPEHGSTSFTTASVLVALAMARDQGVRVPRRLVDRGLALVETCRKPDWAFAYSWDHRFLPQGRINKVQGSLARTPACQLAYLSWERKVPAERVVQALDRLDRSGRFLQIARKYPIPHETWFQNSGYFCFYGYFYATGLFAHVPEDVAAAHRRKIAAALAPLQEEDGSFWDYQLYGYHKAYGTGYVLLALARCRPR